MKPCHVLSVSGEPQRYTPLLQAVTAAGWRVGWLDVDHPEVALPGLDPALDAGALRAVAVAGRATVAVRRRSGPVVLGDLLRQHFLGCRLVLVRGADGLPVLEPMSMAWSLETGAASLRLTTEELLELLRKPPSQSTPASG